MLKIEEDIEEEYEDLLSELEDLEILEPPYGSSDFDRIIEIKKILKEMKKTSDY